MTPGSASDYLPHNYPVNSVAYTGTHDNETLVSWYQTITSAERTLVRDYLYDYTTPETQLYKSMIGPYLPQCRRHLHHSHAGLLGWTIRPYQ